LPRRPVASRRCRRRGRRRPVAQRRCRRRGRRRPVASRRCRRRDGLCCPAVLRPIATVATLSTPRTASPRCLTMLSTPRTASPRCLTTLSTPRTASPHFHHCSEHSRRCRRRDGLCCPAVLRPSDLRAADSRRPSGRPHRADPTARRSVARRRAGPGARGRCDGSRGSSSARLEEGRRSRGGRILDARRTLRRPESPVSGPGCRLRSRVPAPANWRLARSETGPDFRLRLRVPGSGSGFRLRLRVPAPVPSSGSGPGWASPLPIRSF